MRDVFLHNSKLQTSRSYSTQLIRDVLEHFPLVSGAQLNGSSALEFYWSGKSPNPNQPVVPVGAKIFYSEAHVQSSMDAFLPVQSIF